MDCLTTNPRPRYLNSKSIPTELTAALRAGFPRENRQGLQWGRGFSAAEKASSQLQTSHGARNDVSSTGALTWLNGR